MSRAALHPAGGACNLPPPGKKNAGKQACHVVVYLMPIPASSAFFFFFFGDPMQDPCMEWAPGQAPCQGKDTTPHAYPHGYIQNPCMYKCLPAAPRWGMTGFSMRTPHGHKTPTRQPRVGRHAEASAWNPAPGRPAARDRTTWGYPCESPHESLSLPCFVFFAACLDGAPGEKSKQAPRGTSTTCG